MDREGDLGEDVTGRVQRALIVEDDAQLRRTLANALRPWAVERRSVTNVNEALRELVAFRPELLILDFRLPDGTAAQLLEACQTRVPLPAIVALSAYAEPHDTFELARLGVRAYLQKPIALRDLDDAVRKALMEPLPLDVPARLAVGHWSLKEAEEALRRTMLEEALRRSEGNRRGAARLLDVSRELLQHALKRLGYGDTAEAATVLPKPTSQEAR